MDKGFTSVRFSSNVHPNISISSSFNNESRSEIYATLRNDY